jgi:NAD-dependent deacetylase
MYEQLTKMVRSSNHIVFFGGAGVSTESGIPDFRSETGLWSTKTKYGCSPEEVVSHEFFMNRMEDFYEFYFERMIFPEVQPNITHQVLAGLEKISKLEAVVTQNIDGLHQAAGSKTVYELHGSIARYFCMKCYEQYDLSYVLNPDNRRKDSFIPRCTCGGTLKPDVVLFNEGLNQQVMNGATQAIRKADLMIVGGTSLVVYPAAGLLDYFHGENLVLINKQSTSYDHQASLVFHTGLGEVFTALQPLLTEKNNSL